MALTDTPKFEPTITLGQLLTVISVLIGALGVGGAGVGVWVSLNNTLSVNTQRIHGLEGTTSELRDVTQQLSRSMKDLVTQQISDARQDEKLKNIEARLSTVEGRLLRLELASSAPPSNR